MINNKIICHILGQLLFVVSVMLTVCLGVGIIYHEDVWLAFGVPVLISLAHIAGSGLCAGFSGARS